jgi:broad specificity phosphatase PhoE
MEIDNQILKLIESLILNGNVNIKLFVSNIISNILKMIPQNKLNFIIEKRLSDKNIYFIRHAEAIHNVLEQKYNGDFSKCNVYDPKLTENGINQTNYTIKKLETLKIEFDSVFVSPLTRAIQTYFLVKNSLNKNVKVFVTDFVREIVSYCDKNKGKKLSLLKKEYDDLNFEYMTKEYWWFDLGLQKENELESKLDLNLRLRLFILWIIFREEKNILIISHSHVFHALQDKGIYNADIQKLENKILLKKIFELLDLK